MRAQVLVVREEDYVTAARVTGASEVRILRSHLLPNVTTAIIVMASLRVSSAILAEASLSFLGLGAQPPTPTWGSMVNTGQRYLENAPGAHSNRRGNPAVHPGVEHSGRRRPRGPGPAVPVAYRRAASARRFRPRPRPERR